MDERVALHTGARRYCLNRAPSLYPLYWEQVEARVRHDHPDASHRDVVEAGDAAGGTPAQWAMLREILFRLEHLVPEEFATTQALQAEILSIARAVAPQVTRWMGPDVILEMERERHLFCAYVEGLSPDELRSVEPLFYRRVLPDREADKVWRRLKRRWGIARDSYWYPLDNGDPPAPHVLAFDESEFWKHLPRHAVRTLLIAQRVRRVWELRWDSGVVYEMDVQVMGLTRDENYWTSEKMDWVVYISHENSITVGGEWMLNLVKRAWPDCTEYLRTTHVPPALLP